MPPDGGLQLRVAVLRGAASHGRIFLPRSECTAEYAKEGTAAADVLPDYEYQARVPGGRPGWPGVHRAPHPPAYKVSIFLGDYATGDVRRALLDASGKLSSVVGFASGGCWSRRPRSRGPPAIWSSSTSAPGPRAPARSSRSGTRRPPSAERRRERHAVKRVASAGRRVLERRFQRCRRRPAGLPAGTSAMAPPCRLRRSPTHTYTAAGAYTAKLDGQRWPRRHRHGQDGADHGRQRPARPDDRDAHRLVAGTATATWSASAARPPIRRTARCRPRLWTGPSRSCTSRTCIP